MPADPSRVPDTGKSAWSIETAIDYLLAVMNEKDTHLLSLIVANDKRYEERFVASQKALELGLSGQKAEISAALTASERAVQKAEVATEKRFDGVNEFRAALDQQQRTLIPRSEVSVLVDGLNDKITNLSKSIEEIKASHRELIVERKGIQGGWGYAVGAIGLFLLLGTITMFVINFIRAMQ